MPSAGHLQISWRRLRSSPIFTLFSVATLALSIGAATAAYSLIHVVQGPPPGLTDVDRLVEVYHFPTGSGPIVNMAWEDYQDLRARQTAFEALTGWRFFQPAIVANGQSMTGTGEVVDGDYFRTLGVAVEAGRLLQPGDDRPDALPAVVISSALSRRIFGGAAEALGKPMRISGTTFHVVGVTGSSFAGLFNGGLLASGLWVPMNVARYAFPELRDNFKENSRDHRWVFVRGRLGAGQSVTQAQAQVAGIGKQLDAEFPIGRDRDMGLPAGVRLLPTPWRVGRPWGIRPMNGRVLGVPESVLRTLSWTLMGAVGLVLLVACTNLANLSLARNSRRRVDMALRLALGASRWRLIREALYEPVLLTVAGGVAGLGVARVLMRVLSMEVAVGPADRRLTIQALPHIDLSVLGVASAMTLVALLVAGVVPALKSTRVDLRSLLALDSAGAVPRWRARRYLIAAQVAISVLLVSIATLYAGEVRRQGQIDSGLDLERLALAQIDFGSQRYEEARARQIADAALLQMARRPGVTAVALSSGLPTGLTTTFGASLKPLDGSSGKSVEFVAATQGVFDTLGVAIARGRAFDERDSRSSAPVVVVSQTAARRLFPTAEAIGREVIFERRRAVGEPESVPRTLMIVGIAADTAPRTGSDSSMAYLPLDQHYEPKLVMVVRTSADPVSVVAPLRTAITSVDPELAVSQIGTGLVLAGPNTSFQRIVASLATVLGTLALVLALGGLYGVLSQIVVGRTREIGVRMALGAGLSSIRRMVVREGISPVLIGLVFGLGLGLIARAAMQPLFMRLVPSVDVTLMVLVPLFFIGAGLIACYLPARRASRVDPNVALRNF